MTIKPRWLLILVVILGFLLRLQGLHQSLWLDEAIGALAEKNNSLITLITKYAVLDFHPPLYQLVLKLWTDIFGYSEVALRLPSVIFSSFTGLFIFGIAKRYFNLKIALVATLLWEINPLSIYYGQEARMYSLAAFAITSAVYFFLAKKWLWYFLFLAIGLYSDYVPFLMLPIFFLASKNKQQFILYHIAFIIFLLPLIPLLFVQLHSGLSLASSVPLWAKVVGGFDLKALPLTLVKFIVGRITIDNKIVYGIVFGSVSLYALFLLARAKKIAFLVWWLVLPLVLGFLLSFKIPIFSYFRFLFVLPAFCLLLASGVGKNKYFALMIVAIFFVSIAYFKLTPSQQREDWRSAVNYIKSNRGVVLMPSLAQSAPLNYYDSILPIFDKNNLPTKLTPHVFLIRYVQELFDPQDIERKYLETKGYEPVDQKWFNGVWIWQYAKLATQ